LIETGVATYWSHRQSAEAVIVTPMGFPVAMQQAERLGVPLIQVAFAPTRHDWISRRKLLTAIQRDVVGAMFRQLMWNKLRRAMNTARRNVLSLPPVPLLEPFSPVNRTHIMVLEAYSPVVAPKRVERPGTYVAGYWFLDEPPGWEPAQELAQFLEAGPPPVFVGFGSTPFPQPRAAMDVVVRALTRAGYRGLVVAGGSGLATGRVTDGVLSVDSVPHDWLFPRVCAAVHHGGAGVTGAALRAGLPSVVVPVFGDQPFWGERVFALGVGPRPIPARKLDVDSLANAISLASDAGMRNRAAALAKQIGAENGIARAVELIEHHLRRPNPRAAGTLT
jgi:UDP:flavonoid glycosyltransferase YjiC (YdhE family)